MFYWINDSNYIISLFLPRIKINSYCFYLLINKLNNKTPYKISKTLCQWLLASLKLSSTRIFQLYMSVIYLRLFEKYNVSSCHRFLILKFKKCWIDLIIFFAIRYDGSSINGTSRGVQSWPERIF